MICDGLVKYYCYVYINIHKDEERSLFIYIYFLKKYILCLWSLRICLQFFFLAELWIWFRRLLALPIKNLNSWGIVICNRILNYALDHDSFRDGSILVLLPLNIYFSDVHPPFLHELTVVAKWGDTKTRSKHSRFRVVAFDKSTETRYPRARPWGKGVGCLLYFHGFSCDPSLVLSSCLHVTAVRSPPACHCRYVYMDSFISLIFLRGYRLRIYSHV